jgi:hypothetical protein
MKKGSESAGRVSETRWTRLVCASNPRWLIPRPIRSDSRIRLFETRIRIGT